MSMIEEYLHTLQQRLEQHEEYFKAFHKIEQKLDNLLQGVTTIMSQNSDLQAQLDAATAAVTKALNDGAAALTDLAAKVASGSPDLPALQADLVTQSNAMTAAAQAFETTVGSTDPAPGPGAGGVASPQVRR